MYVGAAFYVVVLFFSLYELTFLLPDSCIMNYRNAVTGVNIIRFNKDRSKIELVEVYRTPFSEDKEAIGGFRELRLKRLV